MCHQRADFMALTTMTSNSKLLLLSCPFTSLLDHYHYRVALKGVKSNKCVIFRVKLVKLQRYAVSLQFTTSFEDSCFFTYLDVSVQNYQTFVAVNRAGYKFSTSAATNLYKLVGDQKRTRLFMDFLIMIKCYLSQQRLYWKDMYLEVTRHITTVKLCYNIFYFSSQPDQNSHITLSHTATPIVPKLQRSRKESQEPMIRADQCDLNGRC